MWLSAIVFALQSMNWGVNWEGTVVSYLLLLLLLSTAAFCRFFFKSGTLIMPFFSITIREFGMKHAIIPNYGEIVSKIRKKGK